MKSRMLRLRHFPKSATREKGLEASMIWFRQSLVMVLLTASVLVLVPVIASAQNAEIAGMVR